MTFLQWGALVMMGALSLCAKRFPRLRAYMAFALGLELGKLALQRIDVTRPYVGVDLVVVLLEGLLFVAGPIGLAWALKAHWKAVAGFIWACWVYVVLAWPQISGSTLLAFYMAVHLTAHVFITGNALWRASNEMKANMQDKLLVVLAAVGLSGAFVALAWGRDDWGLISLGNTLAYALIAYFSFKADHVPKCNKT